MSRVAFLGLGVMGGPMAGHLAKAGHDVTVYNRTAGKALAWVVQNGHRAAPTPAEAAEGAEFVMVCVGNDADVRSVVCGDHGALDAMEDGSVLVDHTTASAGLARELSAAAAERDVGFVDAPVSGGQAGAENGALTVMCGCEDESVFESARAVITAYAKACERLGPAGAGQLTKMVNQICIAGIVQGLSEAVNFAQRVGPRRRSGRRRARQGRRPELADGQPGADDGTRRVRVRLRRRMDAQGPRHLSRRGPPQRRPAARRPRWSISSTRTSSNAAAAVGTRAVWCTCCRTRSPARSFACVEMFRVDAEDLDTSVEMG